jgi:UDP-glucose 4-epimerase
MNHDDEDPTPRAMDKDEMVEMLGELIDKLERGEVASAALRVFNVDGTHEDIAIGSTDEEKAAALTPLRRRLGELH